jgi:hypothetical protein
VPYLEGRRVSVEEWRAAQPVRPLYSVGDGRTVINADDVHEHTDRTAAINWAREENTRRAAFLLGGIAGSAIPEVTPADWPGHHVKTAEEVEDDRLDTRWTRQRAAIMEATGGIDPGPRRPEVVTDPQLYVPGTKRSGGRTAFREAHPDLPPPNPDRPSQRTGFGTSARRKRYLKQIARDEGITVAEAARLHPPRHRKTKDAS